MNFLDLHDEFMLFELPQTDRVVKPVIIAAGTHLKHFTHLLNGKLVSMLLYESEYRQSPLEKMLTAFFKISLSN